ncbi:hypothetical protein MNV49_004710 [Pseudohyphozyma bogoriensis]|nr:hypothetical protein MNV49_004710 [Pseudohyphozyma bogoriensis]
MHREIESTLLQLSSPATHYPSSPSLASPSLSSIPSILETLENDLDELEETVEAVEEPGVARRLGLAREEVKERREFVEWVKGEIGRVRGKAGLKGERRKRTSLAPPDQKTGYNAYVPHEDSAEDDDGGGGGMEQQHQSILMEQQDRTLTDISGTVEMLRQQARVMGDEVRDQNSMLEDLDAHVDRTGTRLEKAQRRMNKFVEANARSPSSWAVFILMIVLAILLFIIVFM